MVFTFFEARDVLYMYCLYFISGQKLVLMVHTHIQKQTTIFAGYI